MIDLKMTVNGKPFTESNFEAEILKAVSEQVKNSITSIVSEEEASQITVDILGSTLDDLSLNVNGPEEIVNKIENQLSS